MVRETLLQSREWQAFQESNSRTALRSNESLALVETLPVVGRYLYTPRFPSENSKIVKEAWLALAHTQKAGWIRVEPETETVLQHLRQIFGTKYVQSAPHDVQPREILVMDIQATNDELLAQMKPKTRYNIRLSEKHGVTVRFSRTQDDMERFIELVYATTERKTIRPHPKQYYRNFFQAFSGEQCCLAIAEHQGTMLAANLLIFFEGMAYYLHGGSSSEGRHLMAPFLLQWRSIEEAKQRGMTHYNFGGVNTRVGQKNSWAGITRFKQGFTPSTLPITFPGTYDIMVAPFRYLTYRILQKIQKFRRLFR